MSGDARWQQVEAARTVQGMLFPCASRVLIDCSCAWLSGQRKSVVRGCFSSVQKKMQKVEKADLKNRIKSGSSKKFDSVPGHQTHRKARAGNSSGLFRF
jgi:hypothetical protein